MNGSKWFLTATATIFLLSIGCVGKKRIEGAEVPTMPPANDVGAPPIAPPTLAPTPPPVVAEAPPPPETPPEPTAVPTEEPAAPPPPPVANPCNKYIVVKGDTLWDISG